MSTFSKRSVNKQACLGQRVLSRLVTLLVFAVITKGLKIHILLSFSLTSTLDFLNLLFAGYTESKNQIQNRQKIKMVQIDFSILIFQKSSAVYYYLQHRM